MREDLRDDAAHLAGLVGPEAPSRHGRRAHPETGGDRGWPLVAGHGVLVGRDAHVAEQVFRPLARHLAAVEVDQHQMVVGAAGDQVQPARQQLLGHRPGVRHRTPLSLPELLGAGQIEADRLARYDVLQGSSLEPREHGLVEPSRVLGTAEHRAATRSGQRLVGGGTHPLGQSEGRLVHPGGDQTGDMGHVDHQRRPPPRPRWRGTRQNRSPEGRRWPRRRSSSGAPARALSRTSS